MGKGSSNQKSDENHRDSCGDYSATAQTIVKLIGGEGNVTHFEHCSTRLRFSVADLSKVDQAGLKGTPGVMGVIASGNQCQVVIGNDVIEVFDEIQKVAHFTGSANAAPAAGGKKDFGSSLANQPIGELVKERGVLPFAALRLIALPLVSLLIGRLLIRDNMLLCVLVLASAMPVASNVVMLRKEAGGDDACITRGVFLTTLLSVVTIPLVSVLLGWLGLC